MLKKQQNNASILRILLFLSILVLTSFFSFSAHAQTDEERIADLRAQIEELERQAGQYRSNIQSEQAKATSLRGEISILENQIKKIQTQISITSKNIDKTSLEIDGLEGEIFDTQKRIDYKKDAIGELLLALYKQDNENLITVLLRNRNLSNFFRQAQYSANINVALFDLISSMKEEKNVLEDQKFNLEDKKSDLEYYNQQQKQQGYSLAQTKSGKNTLLTQTKGQEAQYKKLLENTEKKKAEFFNELRELELKVISGGFYIVHIAAENLPPKGTKLFQYPEDPGYYITQKYGMTTYAKRGAYGGAPHNGVDFSSGFGTPIKAIAAGQIVANGTNDGWGNWVAIKHSPYNLVSVYGHMSSLSFLKVGSEVNVGDIIGYEGSTGNSTGSHLHLSVYKDFFTYLNDKKNGQLYFNYFEGTINPLDYF